MTWEIDYRSGVRQDASGRKYRILFNSRGRQDRLFIEETAIEQGYTIPVPAEPKKLERKQVTTTNAQGEKEVVVHRPKRLRVTSIIWKGHKKHVVDIAPEGAPELSVAASTQWHRCCVINEGDEITPDMRKELA